MECPINPAELQKLKVFINLCQLNPQLLNLPQLSFLKSFIESLGGVVPEGQPDFGGLGGDKASQEKKSTGAGASAEAKASPKEEKGPKVVESDPESDLELDSEGCVEPDTEPDQPMGDASKEPTEEEFDQANDLRSQAASAYSEQKYDEAVKLFTDAIKLNPKSALYYAKRGQAYLKLQKPNACIRDCNRALEINPDSATAYKFRGRANRLLGHWEEAAKDLRQACKLDFDEEADEWLKEVTPNAKKIEQHKQKQDRRKQEREFRDRQERVRKAQEAKRKAAEEGPTKGATGAAGAAGAGGMPNFRGAGEDLFSAFRDPEVSAAMSEIFENPANISKYQNNPKIMNILMKFYSQTEKGAGGAGGAGAGAGGFPGFGGMGGGFPGFGGPGADPDADAGGAGGAGGTGAGAGAGSGGARVDDLD